MGYNYALYVDATSGSDLNDGRSQSSAFASLQKVSQMATSSTAIYVANGTYHNQNFGTGSVNSGSVVRFLNLTNILLSNLPGHSPRIEFDGLAGVSCYNVHGFEVRGFWVEGPARQIMYEEAIADRPLHSKRFSGRGIAVWGGDHIHIHDNVVSHAPGAGIRVDGSDYCTIAANVVYNNTWWSANAESGVVLAQSRSTDTVNTIKMHIDSNTVFGNINLIMYHSASLSDLADGPILDGSGIHVSQSFESYPYGWIELVNNVVFSNGVDGILVQATDRVIIRSNVLFANGEVPRTPSMSRQSYAGLTMLSANDVLLWNNSVSTSLAEDYAYVMDADSSLHPNSPSEEMNLACSNHVSTILLGLVDVSPACTSQFV